MRACLKLKKRGCAKNISTHTASQFDSEEDDYCYTLTPDRVNAVHPTVTVRLNDIDTELMLHIGASVNILDEGSYVHIGSPTLKQNAIPKLHPYGGGAPLQVRGHSTLWLKQTQHSVSLILCGTRLAWVAVGIQFS